MAEICYKTQKHFFKFKYQLKKEFYFLKEKDIHNLFLNLNECDKNSIFDLEIVCQNLMQFYLK